jgi:glutamate N-acetyltransferase/amino-acid N-acetyltransferase
VLINSGQANACTGDLGLIDSLRATKALADQLGLGEEEILICSTGVIGVPIPMDLLLKGIDPLIAALGESVEAANAAATAILTTDLVDKTIAFEALFGDRLVRIGGMAKGSGMIHPDMATMLGFVTCDAGLPVEQWQVMVRRAVDNSFNSVTVDGDVSTNDCLLAFSAGIPLAEEFWQYIENGLSQVCEFLARAITRDGEGATCLIEVLVEGTANDGEARQIARTICGSSLVKTAIHGRDPNWGRIVAAAGRAGVAFDAQAIALWLGPHQLMAIGQPVNFDRGAAASYLKEKEEGIYLQTDQVDIRLSVGDGPGRGRAWGCDLSDQYISINADYTT